MSGMTPATRATFLDALGTLIELEPPWVHLRAELGDGVPADRVEAAVRAEMAYYREHSDEGRDPDSLADLRRRCAAVLSAALGSSVGVETLMRAIRFRPYPDARPALERLRRQGLTVVCVSNWDFGLPDVLERCGLGDLLAGVVTSASAAARKPDPAIFARALELADCAPADALHVGDNPKEDVEGARAAGIAALLLKRNGSRPDHEGVADPAAAHAKPSMRPANIEVPRIASLAEIDQYLEP
jgi:putative hydrolase of the HAD superfamily